MIIVKKNIFLHYLNGKSLSLMRDLLKLKLKAGFEQNTYFRNLQESAKKCNIDFFGTL